MALLERISLLLRANVNDLLAKAEDPEKLAKQLLLDMENQLMQVKTQVAIAIADQHLLERKHREHVDAVAEWRRKAEVAAGKGKDDMAREALERSLLHERLAQGFVQQLEDQKAEAETLRAAFSRLQQKLTETAASTELLLVQRRRARAMTQVGKAGEAFRSQPVTVSLDRLRSQVLRDEADGAAVRELRDGDSIEVRFQAMEQQDRIEELLLELKSRQPRLA